ncbi:MAG: GntR family transcriptional regulator [Methylophilales bacterium]|nr:GntR family transcriptional regulator [Methylophilales bacterium]
MNAPNFSPLYQQIKTLITQSLVANEWRPGEAIPSEVELATRFNVSQGTVRKAIDELATENILVRRQGKGTFVATHEAEGIKLRFLRLVAADGTKELLNNRLLSCERGKASSRVARLLNVKTGSVVIEVKRLLLFSNKPLILDHIVLPATPFKGVTAERIEAFNGSMYRMYETQLGIRMVRADERLTAIGADGEVANQLGLALGTPLLSIERVSYTYGDKPMEWRLGLCLTDNHHYMNELE